MWISNIFAHLAAASQLISTKFAINAFGGKWESGVRVCVCVLDGVQWIFSRETNFKFRNFTIHYSTICHSCLRFIHILSLDFSLSTHIVRDVGIVEISRLLPYQCICNSQKTIWMWQTWFTFVLLNRLYNNQNLCTQKRALCDTISSDF